MNGRPQIDANVVSGLASLASALTGFSEEAIDADRIRRACDELLPARGSISELLDRARRREPAIVEALERAVSVGETWFFRQPDHFRFVRDHLVPSLLAARRARLRAWSAGCASGEEAWSLAATLADAAPGLPIEVLGTDLLARSVATAARGVYLPWSRREEQPIAWAVFSSAARDDESITVAEPLRQLVCFERHNLLDTAPPGLFDIVFCRNVLVYFTPKAAAQASNHLAASVAPGGVLVFGPLDLREVPPGFWRVGRPELQIFQRGVRCEGAR